jgi:hypothetical protein
MWFSVKRDTLIFLTNRSNWAAEKDFKSEGTNSVAFQSKFGSIIKVH